MINIINHYTTIAKVLLVVMILIDLILCIVLNDNLTKLTICITIVSFVTLILSYINKICTKLNKRN